MLVDLDPGDAVADLCAEPVPNLMAMRPGTGANEAHRKSLAGIPTRYQLTSVGKVDQAFAYRCINDGRGWMRNSFKWCMNGAIVSDVTGWWEFTCQKVAHREGLIRWPGPEANDEQVMGQQSCRWACIIFRANQLLHP
jgi:hypothetical protein